MFITIFILSQSMAKTAAQIAEKFAREWGLAKPDAIASYTAVASGLATKAIAAKQKMIDNFAAVMATSKFENRLGKYVGNNLMGDAYTQAVEAKTAITASEKAKIAADVELKRALNERQDAVLQLYKDAVAGNITVPPNVADSGLKAMLVQGINANQYTLGTESTALEIYTATAVYMNQVLGWPEKQ